MLLKGPKTFTSCPLGLGIPLRPYIALFLKRRQNGGVGTSRQPGRVAAPRVGSRRSWPSGVGAASAPWPSCPTTPARLRSVARSPSGASRTTPNGHSTGSPQQRSVRPRRGKKNTATQISPNMVGSASREHGIRPQDDGGQVAGALSTTCAEL